MNDDDVNTLEFKRMLNDCLKDIRERNHPTQRSVGIAEGSGCTSKHFLRGGMSPRILKKVEDND